MQEISSLTSSTLLGNLIELKESTTEYLEQCRGMKLKVSIEFQEEQSVSGKNIIKRVSKLYFDSVTRPVLYSVSYLIRENLTHDEFNLLVNDEIPMGRLFISQNSAEIIEKRNMAVSKEDVERDIAEALHSSSLQLYRKSYDYWVGNREIGKILEFFNEESLQRI